MAVRVDLPVTTYPKTIDTLGKLLDDRYSLTIVCENQDCRHSVKADLQALVDRLGRDHSSMHPALAPKLRCSKCGGKTIGLRLGAPKTVADLRRQTRTDGSP